MQNIKKIAIYSICIISTQMCNYSLASWFVSKESAQKGLTAIGEGVQSGMENSAKIAADSAPNIGSDAAKILSNGMIDSANTAGIHTHNAAKDFGLSAVKETIEKAGPAAELLAKAYVVGQVAYTAGQLWSIGKDIKNGAGSIKSYYYPTQEQKNQVLETERKYNYLSTEKTFKKCLLKNVASQRSSSGLPAVCDEYAQMFAMFAGNKEANEITETFKQYFNEPKK